LAAILLIVAPRVGLIATLSIISTDVAHNLWFFQRYHLPFNWILAAQCAFLIFVLATISSAWRCTNERRNDLAAASSAG
jgi:uncharacterized membrane protein